jgi:hypothetical protein
VPWHLFVHLQILYPATLCFLHWSGRSLPHVDFLWCCVSKRLLSRYKRLYLSRAKRSGPYKIRQQIWGWTFVQMTGTRLLLLRNVHRFEDILRTWLTCCMWLRLRCYHLEGVESISCRLLEIALRIFLRRNRLVKGVIVGVGHLVRILGRLPLLLYQFVLLCLLNLNLVCQGNHFLGWLLLFILNYGLRILFRWINFIFFFTGGFRHIILYKEV